MVELGIFPQMITVNSLANENTHTPKENTHTHTLYRDQLNLQFTPGAWHLKIASVFFFFATNAKLTSYNFLQILDNKRKAKCPNSKNSSGKIQFTFL